MSAMRERWVEFMRLRGFTGNVLAQDAVKAAIAFAEDEVRLALQPREQAPGLAEAERAIRNTKLSAYEVTQCERKAIADELDRLRAALARLRGIEERMAKIAAAYVRWHDDNDCGGESAMSDIGDVLEWADVRKLGGEP